MTAPDGNPLKAFGAGVGMVSRTPDSRGGQPWPQVTDPSSEEWP